MKYTTFRWNTDFHQDFEDLKIYLDNPPILQPTVSTQHFLLYTDASSHSLVALLAQHDSEGKEYPVYYISCTLLEYEVQYIAIERQCLALVFPTQKLRHYLLNVETHAIITFDPLKHLFSKIDLLGCLAKWVMMLTKFDLKFVSQKAIKG